MSQRFLRVYPNPYAHLDHDGYPAGAVPKEGAAHNTAWVGAKIDQEQTRVLRDYGPGDPRSADQITRFTFPGVFEGGKPVTSLGSPVPLVDSPYYRTFLRDGSLKPADEETARVTGVDFVAPAAAIEQAKKAAIDQWRSGSKDRPEPDWAAHAATPPHHAASPYSSQASTSREGDR